MEPRPVNSVCNTKLLRQKFENIARSACEGRGWTDVKSARPAMANVDAHPSIRGHACVLARTTLHHAVNLSTNLSRPHPRGTTPCRRESDESSRTVVAELSTCVTTRKKLKRKVGSHNRDGSPTGRGPCAGELPGRGLHSFTSQLNLSRFDTQKHRTYSKHPLNTPLTRATQPLRAPLSHKKRSS